MRKKIGRNPVWRIDDPQGDESGKVKYEIVPYTRGKGVDLGCGPKKAFPHFIGVDNCVDGKLFNIQFKPDVTVEDCSVLPYADGELDFVFSSHLLEHIVDHKAALKEWRRVLKTDGHLVLYLPHRDHYPNIGTYGSNPDHKHDFLPDELLADLCALGGWNIIVKETRAERREYSFLLVLQKRNDWQHNHLYLKKRPEKMACVVRYGGYGDMIQASGVLPELKKNGYHITMMTTEKGKFVLENDPNIDAWFIQDHDQVPNGELAQHFEANARRFDRFVNLCESVEGSLLLLPGTTKHGWPKNLRHRVTNLNYGEVTAEIAGTTYKNDAKFYPNVQEETEARKLTSKGFGIMWVTAGSSIHKFYPWMDTVITRLLAELPESWVVMVGDETGKILEQGWENEPRVLKTCGVINIRQTMALAQRVKSVVGPETGVLNAVAFERNQKICMLSHSSEENLTKHWTNTVTLTGQTTCYPCHQLHYGNQYCNTHNDSGAAMCQVTIDPDALFAAVAGEYVAWKLRAAA
jgi:ADP-heptose:LPS heptosyltransferase